MAITAVGPNVPIDLTDQDLVRMVSDLTFLILLDEGANVYLP